MAYKVTAPLVIIKSIETKADWYGYDGATVPTGLNDERCKELVKEGMLEKVKDGGKSESSDAPPKDEKPAHDAGIDKIAKFVGADKALAQEYLDAEQAKGDNARDSLVTKLQKVLAAEAPAS